MNIAAIFCFFTAACWTVMGAYLHAKDMEGRLWVIWKAILAWPLAILIAIDPPDRPWLVILGFCLFWVEVIWSTRTIIKRHKQQRH